MKVKVKRQDAPGTEPYWQTFIYKEKGSETVAAILDWLNNRDNLVDEKGNICRRIQWEYSCMQKKCGGCAMVINHEPGLACSTFIDTSKVSELVLEPLTKFPVIADLCVDRSCIQEYLKEVRAYSGKIKQSKAKEFENQYSAAKCLKCGLCLEVCPNYTGTGKFYGALWANDAYLLSTFTAKRKRKLKKQYRKHFEAGCSRSLACRDICPVNIPTLSSIGYMNRLF